MSNIFSEFLGSIFGKAKINSVVGIDIGSSSIKAVQAKLVDGKAILETYGALSLGTYNKTDHGTVTNLPPEIISKAVLDIVNEMKTNTSNSAFVLPSQNALVFVLELPDAIGEAELPEVVKNEARAHIPVAIADVTLDWFVIPKREGLDASGQDGSQNKKEILVVAVLGDVVKRFQSIISPTGLESQFLEVEVFSAVRAVLGRELSPVLLIDMGASKTKLTIVEYGVVWHVHIINKGGADVTQSLVASRGISFSRAEELKILYGLSAPAEFSYVSDTVRLSTDYIFSEANAVVLEYEKKYNKAVSKVILYGGASRTKGFAQVAEDAFRCDVVYAHPFDKLDSPEFLVPTLTNIGPEFVGAIGATLRLLRS
ncbi:MAG: pilus assembly protein PilM [Minisyncoccia bacterium]